MKDARIKNFQINTTFGYNKEGKYEVTTSIINSITAQVLESKTVSQEEINFLRIQGKHVERFRDLLWRLNEHPPKNYMKLYREYLKRLEEDLKNYDEVKESKSFLKDEERKRIEDALKLKKDNVNIERLNSVIRDYNNSSFRIGGIVHLLFENKIDFNKKTQEYSEAVSVSLYENSNLLTQSIRYSSQELRVKDRESSFNWCCGCIYADIISHGINGLKNKFNKNKNNNYESKN